MKRQTRRLHLITNPRKPDVFMALTEITEPETARDVPTLVAETQWAESSGAEVPAAS